MLVPGYYSLFLIGDCLVLGLFATYPDFIRFSLFSVKMRLRLKLRLLLSKQGTLTSTKFLLAIVLSLNIKK